MLDGVSLAQRNYLNLGDVNCFSPDLNRTETSRATLLFADLGCLDVFVSKAAEFAKEQLATIVLELVAYHTVAHTTN
jgi:hypothetical protein